MLVESTRPPDQDVLVRRCLEPAVYLHQFCLNYTPGSVEMAPAVQHKLRRASLPGLAWRVRAGIWECSRGAAHNYPSSHRGRWSKLHVPALHRTLRTGQQHIRLGRRRKVAEKLHRTIGGTPSANGQIACDLVAQNLAA